ncbi:MAG TPA: hypothetical protein VEL07_02680, partial [Planctomycetota bacterium]|nr:hypothetical protein [Planctomycetota bacterium]
MKTLTALALMLALVAACGGGSSPPDDRADTAIRVRPNGAAELLVHVAGAADGPAVAYALITPPRLGTLVGELPACYYQAGGVEGADTIGVRAQPAVGAAVDVTITMRVVAGGPTCALPDATPLAFPTWTARQQPIYTGWEAASDASVILKDGTYLMAYTGIDWADPAGPRAAMCLAGSVDGMAWTPRPPVAARLPGSALLGREGTWETHLEGPELIDRGDSVAMLYSGYTHKEGADELGGYPAHLGAAVSTDRGTTFARVGSEPVLRADAAGHDRDAVYSPTVVRFGGGYVMVYAGHHLAPPAGEGYVRLLGATSLDGIRWTRFARQLLQRADSPAWIHDAVAEPGLVQGPDGWWYLFFTGLKDSDRVIGQARGRTPFGPWTVSPQPAIPHSPAGGYGKALAPCVLRVADTGRMWFLGTDVDETRWAICY